MFDIPESDIVGVRVDEEAIKTNKCPEYIHSRSVNQTENSSPAIEIKETKDDDNKISIPTR